MNIIMQKTNSVGFNIRKVRELKGFSQDYKTKNKPSLLCKNRKRTHPNNRKQTL